MNSMKNNLQKIGLNFVCSLLVMSSSAIFSKFTVTLAQYNVTIYVEHLVMRMISPEYSQTKIPLHISRKRLLMNTSQIDS